MRDGKEWTKLPRAGRTGDPPDWPDETVEPDPSEIAYWNRLWSTPQALIWEADQTYDLVAFYVRTYLEAMHPRAGAQARTFAKQLAEQLYLTGPALMQGRYVIAGSAEEAAIDAAVKAASGKPQRKSARERLGSNVVPINGDPEDDEPQPETDIAPEEPPF